MEAFSRNVFERDCRALPPDNLTKKQDMDNQSPKRRLNRIGSLLPQTQDQTGLEQKQHTKNKPRGILVTRYNLILWYERLPLNQRAARTTMIPKKEGAMEPGDFRPITIGVLARQLHVILAKRISGKLNIDPEQRVFQISDDCVNNTILLDIILIERHKGHCSAYLAILDVRKTLDFVFHPAIFGPLRSYSPHTRIRILVYRRPSLQSGELGTVTSCHLSFLT